MSEDHPTFFFEQTPVGVFIGAVPPRTDGPHPYEPFRSPGHYSLHQQLRENRPVRCHYDWQGERVTFTVSGFPEYGVLELRDFGVKRRPRSLLAALFGAGEQGKPEVSSAILFAGNPGPRMTRLSMERNPGISPELLRYAGDYQEKRLARCKETGGLFPPMEALRHKSTGEPHLSLFFNGMGRSGIYLSQRVSFFRAVKSGRRWLFFPTTESCLLRRERFVEHFGELLQSAVVDGEEFWLIRRERAAELESRIRSLKLDNSFRDAYYHAALP